jgi:hypothetical protein
MKTIETDKKMGLNSDKKRDRREERLWMVKDGPEQWGTVMSRWRRSVIMGHDELKSVERG